MINFKYEIIVVDNNSTDNTIDIVNSFNIKNIRIVKEEKQGLLYARDRGIKESQYEIIFFINDDILVMPNWITSHLKIFSENPKVGLAAAPLKFPNEYKISPLIDHFSEMYAVCKEIQNKDFFIVGMQVLRKETYEFLYKNGYKQKLIGRSVNPFAGGEDIEFSLSLRYTPYICAKNNESYGIHYLGEDRLNMYNLLKLKQASGFILATIAPYRYVYKTRFTSYYYYLIRTILAYFSTFLKINKVNSIRRTEKLEQIKTLILRKRNYQDLEKEIRNADWNILNVK